MSAGLAAFDEAEQVARLRGLAQRALAAWALGDARVALIKYRENAVFGVTARDGTPRVLRVHRPAYRSDEHIRSEAAWMQALPAGGVQTPAALATTAGDVLTVAAGDGVPEPRQCDLITWVAGTPLGSLEHGVDLGPEALRRTYERIGEIAARIHAHGAVWTKPAGFTRPAWDVTALVGDTPTFGRFWELDALSGDQRALLLRTRDLVRTRLAALGAPNLLIHGDLIPDNLLESAAGTRVIDFDDCGWSWWAFELATSLFPLLVTGGFEDGLAGYVAGYRRVRAFPEDELAYLPTLLIARGLSYLGWPVGRPEIHSQQEIVPLYVAGMTDLAERYLANGLVT